MNWSKENTEALILEYKQRNQLWNINCEQYHNKSLRLKGYEELASILSTTSEEIKKKINNLRSQFLGEQKIFLQSSRSGNGVDDVYTPRWWCFEMLNFLKESTVPKDSISNLSTCTSRVSALATLVTCINNVSHQVLMKNNATLHRKKAMFSAWRAIRKIFTKSFVVGGYLGYAACLIHCTGEYLGDVVVCHGPSMEPTLFSYDIILTEHVSITRKKINRGDIIVARSPSNPKEYICKRVRGIAGDKIKKGFSVYVVPAGHVWLEGDNKNNSSDSRWYGPVPMGLLRSRVMCRVFPFENAQVFSKS